MSSFPNLYKKFSFKKDIFSKSKILLKKSKLSPDLKKIIFELGFKGEYLLESVIANNLNSKTYKISQGKKSYLIKIENKKTTKNLKILNILKKQKFTKKTIIPIIYKKNKNYFLYKKHLITLYPFINGKLYSGEKTELESSINEIIKLIFQLSKVEKYKNFNSFNYFSKDENKMIKGLKKRKKYFNKIFSNNKIKFDKFIPLIIFEWERLKKKKIYCGKKQLSPWDIHPHNIITNKNSVRGIIDLTGIKYMPIGYALSYGLVKLLRQYFIKQKIKKNYYIFAKSYIYKINARLGSKFNNEIFYDLAVSEVLRRILIIIKKNNSQQDKSLNHIMEILLNNLIECKLIFTNDKK